MLKGREKEVLPRREVKRAGEWPCYREIELKVKAGGKTNSEVDFAFACESLKRGKSVSEVKEELKLYREKSSKREDYVDWTVENAVVEEMQRSAKDKGNGAG